MKQGLKKREIILLFVVGTVGAVLLVNNFILSPMYKAYSAKVEKYNGMTLQREMLEDKFMNEPLTRNLFEKAEAAMLLINEEYPTDIPNEEVDRIITKLCADNNLTPASLSLSSAAEDFRIPPIPGREDERDSVDYYPAFRKSTANMKLLGTYSSLKSLIDQTADTSSIFINKFAIATDRVRGLDSFANIDVVFEVYMLSAMED